MVLLLPCYLLPNREHPIDALTRRSNSNFIILPTIVGYSSLSLKNNLRYISINLEVSIRGNYNYKKYILVRS